MKSNKLVLALGILTFSSAILFTGCKKKEEPKEPVADESGQAGTDSREATAENDNALSEINQVISENHKMAGRGAEAPKVSICGLVIDSVQAGSGILKLDYDTTSCNNRTRTGSIIVTVQNYTAGARWKQQGTVVKVDFLNYKITRTSDQKSIMFNGTQYYTNTSGGNWWDLIVWKTKQTLVTDVSGSNLIVKWHDNTQATYNINRKLTYSYPNNILTVKCEGTGTNSSLTNLENFGTTRQGDAFTSQVSTPIVWNVTCGGGAPLQGVVDVKVASKSFGLLFTYGVDVSGNPVSVNVNSCAYGWKLQWTVGSNTQTKVIGYK